MIFSSVHVTTDGDSIIARLGDAECKVQRLSKEGQIWVSNQTSNPLFVRTLEFIFAQERALKEIHIEAAATVSREEFFQTPGTWNKGSHIIGAEKWVRTAERPHPIRGDRKTGLFYERYAPAIGKTVSFRGVDPEKDVDTFHQWQNQPRVAFFWELAQPIQQLQEYLIKTQNDPHMIPTFVEFDGRPVGYFEMYWTLEDRLGPYYEADAFDRGFHFLIGEKDALGFEKTDTIVKSALHFLFLDDPRTRRVMAEPRHDNKKVLRYAESSGWKKLKEFDFPHKRAALMECKREHFFNGERL